MTEPLFEFPATCGDCGRATHPFNGCLWCAESDNARHAAEIAALASLDAAAEIWRREAKWELLQYRTTGEKFTSAEVTGKLRARGIETKDARAMGSIIRSLSKAGLIECVGVCNSPLPEHHTGLSREWRWAA